LTITTRHKPLQTKILLFLFFAIVASCGKWSVPVAKPIPIPLQFVAYLLTSHLQNRIIPEIHRLFEDAPDGIQ